MTTCYVIDGRFPELTMRMALAWRSLPRRVYRDRGVASVVRPSCLVFAASLLSLLVFDMTARAMAQEVEPPQQQATDQSGHAICAMMESVAQANALPVDFFVRLIWQESRFHPDEIGPLTRSGQRALGIAQFMPGTAMERQLFEPFNPAAALPKSGEFLAELRKEFGNLGLAAAAYNAGPQRVRDYLSHARDLPLETRNYVRAVTGRPVEDWAMLANNVPAGQSNELWVTPASTNCRDILTLLERVPNRLSAQWDGRKFPSWCKALRHPNVEECGPVHLIDTAIKTTGIVLTRSHVHLARSSSH